MSRVKYTSKEVDLLGRLMRAEATGEGVYGMQLVGNVVVNRVIAPCLTFKNIKTINQAVYQKGQFEGTKIKLFNARATAKEKKAAMNCIKYWRGKPAVSALFFQNPGKGKPCKKRFWGVFSGRYKNHCFYNPDNISACKLKY